MADITNKPELKGYMDFVMDFHQSMQKHKLILAYEGEVTQDVTKAFTAFCPDSDSSPPINTLSDLNKS